MKISFHGASRTVTGSKHLISLDNGQKILLDCGMFQGMGRDTDTLNRKFGFDPATVSAVVLSHAHIDHSGLLPRLCKEGFSGKIYATNATVDLCSLLLKDSAQIQENDARFHNKTSKVQGTPFQQPLYTTDDAEACMDQFEKRKYGEWFKILDDVEVLFADAGHIIGSASVHVRITENGQTRQLSFSGDLGRYRDVILKSPQTFPQADFIILESTYGNSLHEPVASAIDHLLEWIEETCIRKKGKLIIPAFSLGRTQEILFALNQLELENRLPKIDYFLDSPLSMKITEMVKNHTQHFNKHLQKIMQTDEDPFMFNGLQYIESVEESKRLNYRKEPCVIISASGMAEAGRVKHHISNAIENSRNAILMTGYCEPRSLGGKLLAGRKEVGIFGIPHEVHAAIGSIKSMSAHGDYEDMTQWMAEQDMQQVQKIFLVHGEYDVQVAFRSRLLKKGFKEVEIPDLHEGFGLG
jgi:metallo-beta-lactamase family protein